MLRIDVDADDASVPADNPFVDDASFRPEIWAWGLRNPWRYPFDRETGDLWIADVGQSLYEEIDFQPRASTGGEDYGWNEMEGMHCYQDGCDDTGLTYPIYEYGHDEGCSITGGYVDRGCRMPGHHGKYFFGDVCGGFVRTLEDPSAAEPTVTDWPSLQVGTVTSFGADGTGGTYIVQGPYSGHTVFRRRSRQIPRRSQPRGGVAHAEIEEVELGRRSRRTESAEAPE